MPALVFGPLLRHVDQVSATIFVETDARCLVSVATTGDLERSGLGRARTFHIRGHHYALVIIEGLEPGSVTPYEVRLDDDVVWPPAGSTRPPSRIRTPGGAGTFTVVFGSCRYATPLVITGEDDQEFPPDALDTYSSTIAGLPEEQWPDALVLLGDQVYADETAEETKKYLASRRDLDQPPHDQLADFEEFTYIYRQSWTDPDIRWLLSTIPSSMIFDDHDVIDDWNTSAAWRASITATDWWEDRVAGALGSYWVHQHIGNLSPAELRADPNFARITAVPDGYELLREMALEADRNPGSIRWSYVRKWHTVRLLMIDSRAARSLDEGARAMVDDQEFQWVEQQLIDAGTEEIEHVLVGSSLPWMMPRRSTTSRVRPPHWSSVSTGAGSGACRRSCGRPRIWSIGRHSGTRSTAWEQRWRLSDAGSTENRRAACSCSPVTSTMPTSPRWSNRKTSPAGSIS